MQNKSKAKQESHINIGGYKICVEDDSIAVDRSGVFADTDFKAVKFKSSKLDGIYELDIFVDNGIIEIFINGGKYVITNVVYNMQSYIKYDNINELEMFEINNPDIIL